MVKVYLLVNEKMSWRMYQQLTCSELRAGDCELHLYLFICKFSNHQTLWNLTLKNKIKLKKKNKQPNSVNILLLKKCILHQSSPEGNNMPIF